MNYNAPQWQYSFNDPWITTSGSSGYIVRLSDSTGTSNTLSEFGSPAPAFDPPAVPDDPIAWLRGRVEEICDLIAA